MPKEFEERKGRWELLLSKAVRVTFLPGFDDEDESIFLLPIKLVFPMPFKREDPRLLLPFSWCI